MTTTTVLAKRDWERRPDEPNSRKRRLAMMETPAEIVHPMLSVASVKPKLTSTRAPLIETLDLVHQKPPKDTTDLAFGETFKYSQPLQLAECTKPWTENPPKDLFPVEVPSKRCDFLQCYANQREYNVPTFVRLKGARFELVSEENVQTFQEGSGSVVAFYRRKGNCHAAENFPWR